MKLEQLRQIIREEVRSAVKEEIQDMLIEAVKIASTPTTGTPSVVETSSKTSIKPQQDKKAYSQPKITGDPLMEMLNMTRNSMTSQDYSNVISADSSMVQKPNFAQSMASQMGMTGNEPGIDISQLDFVSKAKAVFDASNKKDKQRKGLE